MNNNRMIEFNQYYSTKEFEEANTYQGDDLGAVWTREETRFRVWAPTAETVILNLYRTGDREDLFESIPMDRDTSGTWLKVLSGDWNGTYYTYCVTVDGETKEAVDPYAKAVGVNGDRGMVIDLASTNPEGFLEEQKPVFANPTDAVLYELHIRDFSVDESSGMQHKGKYLAFTEQGTKNASGDSTGIDYLKDLGITHVHLLPCFDFATVDESRLHEPQFNWGYDPKNYNAPDGSYSTDPYHGEVRVKEFKQMVQALHQKGIRVVMDMVYNHTMENVESNFNKIVPGYYHRLNQDGTFSNASGCGNETASERPMMRKFIIDSVLYWAREYHIDGFRFDLMGIHDNRTMNELRQALYRLEPGLLLYGEGWTGGTCPLPDWERALKANIRYLDPGIAAFNDNVRDGIKGSAFINTECGFVSGREGMEDTIKFAVTAATWQPGIDYSHVLYSNEPWAAEPTQTVNYVSAHDNLALWDKLVVSTAHESRENRVKMNLLAAAIVLTSQGIPFFQAGEEFLRSKPIDPEHTKFEENSYNSPDSVNSLKWNLRTENKLVVDYYKGLIAFRRSHQALRMTTTEEIRRNLCILENMEQNVVAFLVTHPTEGEICVIFNANKDTKVVNIPDGEWNVYAKGTKAGTKVMEVVSGGAVRVEPISALILAR